MPEITSDMVKNLREMTGQGMMECKKALSQTSGDVQAAIDLLRTKGMAAIEKKAARTTQEGLVAVKSDGASAAMVEVVCETDFCARNDEFRGMVDKVAELAFAAPAGAVEATPAISAAVQACFTKIGENMKYSRGVKITAPKIGYYIHHNNKVGVVVGIEGALDDETTKNLLHHIAFADPMAIDTAGIPADVVAKEREIAKAQAIEAGKPPQIAEKMVEGKVRKFLAEHALLEQPFVKDDKKKVKDILGGAKVLAFARFAIGQ